MKGVSRLNEFVRFPVKRGFYHIQSDFSRCTSLVVKEGGKRKQTFAHVRRKSGHKEDTVFIGEYMSSRIILTASYWHDVKKMIFVIWNFITFKVRFFVIKTSDHVMICSFFLGQFIRTLYKFGGGGGDTLPITNVFKVFTFDDENIATTYDKSLRKLAITRQHFNLWTTGTHTLGTPVYRNVFISYLRIKFSERRY